MPSPRKRIGFLPRSEVQNIIDKICLHNNLSQSNVTGILVEEALNSKGVLNSSITKLSFDFNANNVKSLLFNDDNKNNEDDNVMEEDSISAEVKMINDFLEFKFFKNIVTKNKNKFKI